MAMGNPYYVEPLGGLDVGAKLTQVMEGGRAVARRKEWEDNAAKIIQGGNPTEISNLMVKFPEMADTIQNAMGLSKRSTGTLLDIAKQTLAMGEVPLENLAAVIEGAKQNGENVSLPIQLLQKLSEDPTYGTKWAEKYTATFDPKSYAGYAKATGIGGDENQTETEGYVGLLNQASMDATGQPLSAAEKAKAMMSYKRAQAREAYANKFAQRTAEEETAQNIAFNGQLGKALAEISTTADIMKAKGEVSPIAKVGKAKTGVSGKLATMAQYYTSLDSVGGIINENNSSIDNIIAATKSSKAGQVFGRVVGSGPQTFRDAINSMKPLLMNDVRASTDMSARGLDSEKELAFYLQAATDETKSLQSNMAAIIAFDEAYGDGSVAEKLRSSGNISGSLIDAIKSQGNKILTGREGEESGGDTVQPAPIYAPPSGGMQRLQSVDSVMKQYKNIPPDVTADDVQYTMEKEGLTFEQVMQMVGATK